MVNEEIIIGFLSFVAVMSVTILVLLIVLLVRPTIVANDDPTGEIKQDISDKLDAIKSQLEKTV